MRHLATAIFPILHPISVFRCFITHTSASELHTTFPFILLLHKIYYYAYPTLRHKSSFFFHSIIPTMYSAWIWFLEHVAQQTESSDISLHSRRNRGFGIYGSMSQSRIKGPDSIRMSMRQGRLLVICRDSVGSIHDTQYIFKR
jgi:hypothetical protein